MAPKITRTVTINGAKHWIRANTEQEYADKLLKLVGTPDTPQSKTNTPLPTTPQHGLKPTPSPILRP